MTDYSELKRLADNYAALIDSDDRDSELEARDLFQDAARVDVVQGLIAENEALRRTEAGLQEMLRRQNKTHCRMADEIKALKKASRND